MQQHFFRLGREIGELPNWISVLRQPRLVVFATLRCLPIRASIGMPRHALLAVAAEHRRACDDVVAGLEIGDGLSDFLDYAGSLVAEDRGPAKRIAPLDEMQ